MKGAEEAFSIEKVYRITRSVVGRMLMRRAIPYREREDTEQELMRKFIEKQDKIINAFQGNANFDTYLTAILYRMCCEVIRSDVKNWDHVKSDDPSYFFSKEKYSGSMENRLIIDNESEYLKKVLQLFDDEQASIVLFLKVLFGVSVSPEDLENYDSNYKRKGIDRLLLNRSFENNQDVYKALAKTVECSENRKVGGDAVRIWLNKRMDQIINRLNGTIQRSNYDRKSFRILFDYTYSKD